MIITEPNNNIVMAIITIWCAIAVLAMIGLFSIMIGVLRVWHLFSSMKWFCNVLGWHLKPDPIDLDGSSSFGICSRCNKKILKNSF